MHRLVRVFVLASLPLWLQGQYYPAPGSLSSFKVAGTFHGKLKDLSAKEIVIENGDDQLVTIRRSGKTKFFRNKKQIKPSEIEPGTSLTIEAAEDADLSILALTVTVDPPPAKSNQKQN